MNPIHISDDLPSLLSGEADRQTVLSVGAHLRSCVDCEQELVSAVVAHAALTSARRFAPEIVSPPPDTTSDSDEAAAAAQRARHAAPTELVERDRDRAADLPDLSVVFAQVRSEVDEPAPASTDELTERRAKRRGGAYLIGAAAAAIVIGGGFGIYAATNTGGSPAGREVAIAAYDKGTVPASARVNGDTISLDASSLPTLSGKRYEVWLTNSGRTALQPIGWIGSNGKATLTVPNKLMQQYGDLEVSVQANDAKDYTYSGTSVLRGSLT